MRIRILALGLALVFTVSAQLDAQYATQISTYKKCFIGSSFFMLGNFLPEDKPHFVQLNLGYRLTGRDVVSLELKTWRYHKSLGIPYGKFYNDPEEKYTGYIQERGFALAYQRYLWKNLYAGVHVMSAWQSFVNGDGKEIDKGFQIFNTYRLGYHVKLFNDKFFIEPSVAVTHRPYHTTMPDPFKQFDDKWTKFFFGEPGLHFGYNF
ncbi:hypothetical protein [Neolewinella persica]|uniref:hypothetical protein n=1 Tax=Neolewinella persica TaxID=70998 RepID=UPI00037E3A0E|nr:hypothetical protein [Neolewinella persica]